MQDIYAEIARLIAAGRGAALVTVIATASSTPRDVAAKMLVRADGSISGSIGGGAVEKEAIGIALKVIKTGQAQRHHFTLKTDAPLGMACGGDMEIFVEPVLPPPALYICGGGHIAKELTPIARACGFRVTVLDNRADYATAERFPAAEDVRLADYSDVFAGLTVDAQGYIVIVTHGHHGDEVVLGQALQTPARYIGMIGSQAKTKAIFDHLKAAGVAEARLAEVHTPIGLKIGAETPAELAVCIMAEIISVRRGA